MDSVIESALTHVGHTNTSNLSNVFIPNYTTKSFLHDVLMGALYPYTIDFARHYFLHVTGAVFILTYGYLAIMRYADPLDDKRRAWTLSVISSGLLSLVCTPLSFYWIELYIRRGQVAAGNEIMSAGALEDSLMVFFFVFMWMDLIISYFRYPGHMELCTGYIHHTVYLILVGNSLKWRYTRGLALMFCEEIPTFILGLGFLNPRFKSERLFGYSFFLLRIVFHTFVTIVATREIRHHSFFWVAGYLALAIHLWWFSGWIRRQFRLKKIREIGEEETLISLVANRTRQEFESGQMVWLPSPSRTEPLRLDTMLSINDPEAAELTAGGTVTTMTRKVLHTDNNPLSRPQSRASVPNNKDEDDTHTLFLYNTRGEDATLI